MCQLECACGNDNVWTFHMEAWSGTVKQGKWMEMTHPASETI